MWRIGGSILKGNTGVLSAACRLPELRVRTLKGSYVSCECCVLSGRGPCDGQTTRPEEFYRVCVGLSVMVKPQ